MTKIWESPFISKIIKASKRVYIYISGFVAAAENWHFSRKISNSQKKNYTYYNSEQKI